MTYEYVYVGAEPDDGTGDPLRTAYIKINNNFAQLQQFGTTKISNGTSNINIPYANGAIYTMIGDVPNVMVINPTGVTSSNLTAVGNVAKGDMMVSAGNGRARAEENPMTGAIIGKALEDFTGLEGMIEIVVGRL